MKNNIIKFVSRNEFERRKFPFHGYSIVPHLAEMEAQLAREAKVLGKKNHQLTTLRGFKDEPATGTA